MRRGEVARALSRSITTVRRMEGNELHPWKDERGHNHFDETEVLEVARRLKETGHCEATGDSGVPDFILELQLRSARQIATRLETENFQLRAQLSKLKRDLRRAEKSRAQSEEELVRTASAALDSAEGGADARFAAVSSVLKVSSRR